MKEKNTQSQILKYMDYRFNQIERLITLSLMNDILPQYINDLCSNLSDDIIMLIEDNDFSIVKSEVFSDKLAIYLKTERKVGIKDFRDFKKLFSKNVNNIILVFELKKISAIQKRKFIEEKISYYIKDKELFISKD